MEELREKMHLNSNFKTKPCRSYFLNGYCNYGYRCQYLHSELIYEPNYKQFLLKSFREKGFGKEKLKEIETFSSYIDQLNEFIEGNSISKEKQLFNCNKLHDQSLIELRQAF